MIEQEAEASGQNLMKAISFFGGHKMGVILLTGRVIDTSGIALAHSYQKNTPALLVCFGIDG